ncbi:exodeoxyribonuclease III [Prescottella equi]|uniref:Exodeoxyribonuclease III n=3 Tax=Rhodococcus hoagii TaxID=43767 RepID=E9T319_RHOHA|nr:exodeoxyribonuclease III [Prescottella equi]EGD23231.1 exodeoxyribonuclease III [Prescottella equi ATCC 33707]ERN44346.1 exodeoxyribonuclease [Prescottella equi NBRC 101255 = C 7]CBH49435.1 exodeoxyribonuclease III [Prescottella equi 103S]GBF12802.1 exodeoxyribonuclease [Rhodococcus sp. Br-6]
MTSDTVLRVPHIITTVNVNGVRAAARKGLIDWLAGSQADVVCLQETRASDKQLHETLAPALDQGWHVASAEPSAKGRNGVAVLSRRPADAVRIGFGDDEFADAGRYIEADFDALTVGSLYLPTGEAETPKQEQKERFMASFAAHLSASAEAAVAAGRDVLVCGDWNIAHTERDIKNWKGNVKKSGFLPGERDWVGALLAGGAWVDVVRELHPDVDGPYSWWSYRGKAFDTDAGWRIDYHLTTPGLAARAKEARVERAATYAERWSDHAPVTVQFR